MIEIVIKYSAKLVELVSLIVSSTGSLFSFIKFIILSSSLLNLNALKIGLSRKDNLVYLIKDYIIKNYLKFALRLKYSKSL